VVKEGGADGIRCFAMREVANTVEEHSLVAAGEICVLALGFAGQIAGVGGALNYQCGMASFSN
jgi:hypothetical protein